MNRGDDLPMKWYYMVLSCFDTIVMILCDLHGAGPRIFLKDAWYIHSKKFRKKCVNPGVIFGPFWIILGHSRAMLGHFGSYLGHFGSYLGHFGPFLGHFVAYLEKFAESSNFLRDSWGPNPRF